MPTRRPPGYNPYPVLGQPQRTTIKVEKKVLRYLRDYAKQENSSVPELCMRILRDWHQRSKARGLVNYPLEEEIINVEDLLK